ncbi:MAG: hypothetical protein FJZ90_03300 [Chloroflexi bacterium]|nr:hypothetical protein [Chloroflexota bacterium]
MFRLANDQLVVSVLDPVADQVRLGARYCTGGYIYQVEDCRLGPLVSGPGYPDEVFPPVFDGQGLPEAFRAPLGLDEAREGEEQTVLVLGVGLARQVPGMRGERERRPGAFCGWEVAQSSSTIRMATSHSYQGWAAEVAREVTLHQRTIASVTTLCNTGDREIPLQWFPHPFYPQLETGECCKFNFPVRFPENPGYWLREDGFIVRKLDHPWTRQGHFQMLEYEAPRELVVLQRHPKLGLVAATCDFSPDLMPIWGNSNTFSFEPYLVRTVDPGEELRWSITYDF